MYNACKPVAGSKSFNLEGMALFKAGYCLGMVVAVAQELGMNCIFFKDKPFLPKAAVLSGSAAALTQAFVNYARDNPQDWQDLPSDGLSRAFQQYFPCK
jgi:hypothetical protein